ncbi:hypothetical protein VCR26J2_150206 [Vibrio coralliirubri]|nr:hypothetical protein VCR6J2_220086 [Vibrio coralliirubri]CDT41536.1 hypothetical protein VCR26J2_150206 [Vibrio coralliirubri]
MDYFNEYIGATERAEYHVLCVLKGEKGNDKRVIKIELIQVTKSRHRGMIQGAKHLI